MQIESLHAIELLDSRGMPTVGCRLQLADAAVGISVVPSGASTGKHESCELRDGDEQRYFGKGVQRAVAHINGFFAKAIQGKFFESQQVLDICLCELDGSVNKKVYGANAILAISQAFCVAQAKSRNIHLFQYFDATASQLPVPFMNIVNGGAHADNNIRIQEFMLVPFGFSCFAEALRAGSEIHHVLGMLLKQKNIVTSKGDEGGYAPFMDNIEAVLDLLVLAIKQSGYGINQVGLALDLASSGFYQENSYSPNIGSSSQFSKQQWVDYLSFLVDQYPLLSLEDAAAEDDWQTWTMLNNAVGERVQLVGDDLFVTQSQRLSEGVVSNAANAILIKPNQVGTVSETIATIKLAKDNDYACMISHRSGETEDTFIADLAVGMSTGQIKAGPARQQDRVAKYNRLLWIESILAENACYQGHALARYKESIS